MGGNLGSVIICNEWLICAKLGSSLGTGFNLKIAQGFSLTVL
jgi:hypothetical protein